MPSGRRTASTSSAHTCRRDAPAAVPAAVDAPCSPLHRVPARRRLRQGVRAQQRGRFFAVDAATGKQRWSKNFRRCAAASPTVWKGVVYQPLMHALPCRKHQARRERYPDRHERAHRARAVELPRGSDRVLAAVVDGVLYFGSWDRYVYAVDARTRKLGWRYRTDDRVVAAPAYAHGTIYVPSNSGRLYALNARTGKLRWRSSSFSRFGRREYFYATPTVAYGRVFVGNADGYVYSFGAKSGRLLWARRAGTYVYSAAAVWRRTVYVGTWDGWVVALDAATGTRAGATTHPARSPARRPSWPGCCTSRLGTCGSVDQRHVERGRPRRSRSTRAPDAVWRFPDGKYSPIVADQERVYLVGRTRVYALEAKQARARPRKHSVRERAALRAGGRRPRPARGDGARIRAARSGRSSSGARSAGSRSTACSRPSASAKEHRLDRIRLRRTETVTLEIVDEASSGCGRWCAASDTGPATAVVEWDGRDDDGRLVPDGAYRPRLTLASGARTFVLPNPICSTRARRG